jgi:hypothetical protein
MNARLIHLEAPMSLTALLLSLVLSGPAYGAANVVIVAEYPVKMFWNGEQVSPAGGAESLELAGIEAGIHELTIIRVPGKKVLFEGTVAVADGQQVSAVLQRGNLALSSAPIGAEPETSKAQRAMRIAQGVAGAAATASAVNQGVSDAKDGLQGAQDAMDNGESYRSETKMEMSVSKQGVGFSSETNTASAGPGGMQSSHSGVSATAGAQGVSYGRSTGDASLDHSGVQGSSQERAVAVGPDGVAVRSGSGDLAGHESTELAVGSGGVAVTTSETTAAGTETTSVAVAVDVGAVAAAVLRPSLDPAQASIEEREEAVTALEDDPAATAEILLVMQTDPEPAVQKRAWRVLRARWKRGTGDPAEHQAAAVWLIEHGELGLQVEAMRAFGKYGDDIAIPRGLLEHSEVKLDRAACAATAGVALRQGQPDLAKETVQACQERLTDGKSVKELDKLLEGME